MGRATSNFFWPRPPGALGRGQKVNYHLISITKSISKFFIPNFVHVLTNERCKTYQTGILFCHLGHAPGVGLWGAGGVQGGQNIFFSNTVMWHIKSTGMTSSSGRTLGSRGWGIFNTKYFLQNAKVLSGIHLNTLKYNICSIKLEMKVLRLHW